MDNLTTVLVTGGGAPGVAGTIYSLRNNPEDVKIRIVTVDIEDNVVGKFLSDSFYKVPSPESEEYFPILQRIIEKENVKVIVPQTTREISALSRQKKQINKMGVGVVVSDQESIKKANDKYLVIRDCEKIGIPYPEYFLVRSEEGFSDALKELNFPKNKVVVKPRVSNGLRGLRIITEDVLSLDKFLNEKPSALEIDRASISRIFKAGAFPELLVEEYLPGEEYTVDVFRNGTGAIVIPRIRCSIRSGISFDVKVDMRPDIIRYSLDLAESLDLKFCFGFQFKLDNNNVPRILESNPRVQGTMVTSVFAGFNMIFYSVKEALGEKVDTKSFKIKDGTNFKRYWGGIGIYEKNFLGKI